MGIKHHLLEREIEVLRFRRSLQPNVEEGGQRKKLLFQFYGHDITTGKVSKTEAEIGGRLHTVYADDIAAIT